MDLNKLIQEEIEENTDEDEFYIKFSKNPLNVLSNYEIAKLSLEQSNMEYTELIEENFQENYESSSSSFESSESSESKNSKSNDDENKNNNEDTRRERGR